MHKLNIKANFSGDTIADLKEESTSIATKSADNPNFVFLEDTFTNFVAKQGNWIAALLLAESGDSQKIAQAEEVRLEMEPLMEVVCKQINVQANHVKSKLISSGGTLTSVGGSIGMFEAPIVKSINPGPVSGSLLVTLVTEKRCLGTMIHLIDLATSESKTFFISDRHILLIPNLTRGKEYSLSFAWLGTNSTLVYSDAISRFVAN